MSVGMWDGTRRAWEHLDPLPELPEGWAWDSPYGDLVLLHGMTAHGAIVGPPWERDRWVTVVYRWTNREYSETDHPTRIAAARALVDAVVPRAAAAMVSTDTMTPREIVEARAADVMHVDENGYGFVDAAWLERYRSTDAGLPDPAPYRWDELDNSSWLWNGSKCIGKVRRDGQLWEASAQSSESAWQRLSGTRPTRREAAELLLQYVRGREEPAPSTDDWLPAMAEGSRLADRIGARGQPLGGIIDAHGSEIWIGSDGWLHLRCHRDHDIADVRHLLARRDRARGRYWRDRVRALAATLSDDMAPEVLKLLEEADG